jgi:homoprotocatechuate degradation regulator HpaR
MNYSDMHKNPFNQSLPMIMHDVLDKIMPAYRQLFTRFGVTEQQWRVLRVLWEAGSLSSIEISRKTLLPQNSLVGVLERLEKKALIQRVRSVHDRRQVCATLTSSGKTLGAAVMPELAIIHEEIDSRLTSDEWRQLTYLLHKASQQDTSRPNSEDETANPLRQEKSHG